MRWTALECFTELVFTAASDVWSLGITAIETFTDGELPFPEMNTADIQKHIEGGRRPLRPQNCPDNVYDKLLQCWFKKPEDRPSFTELVTFFEPLGGKFLFRTH